MNCNCILDYIDTVYETSKSMNSSVYKPCSFLDHAHCASKIIRSFEWSNRKLCPVSCADYNFHHSSIQVRVGIFFTPNILDFDTEFFAFFTPKIFFSHQKISFFYTKF